MEGEGAAEEGKINIKIYTVNGIYQNANIKQSRDIRSRAEMNAVLDVFMASEYYSEEKFGTRDFMRAQWIAHNMAYDIASSGNVGFWIVQKISVTDDPIESGDELDIRGLGNSLRRQKAIYDILSLV